MTDAVTRLSIALADRYRLKAVLGAGGMATVYRGEDLKHHREVAIKVLRPELAQVLGAERFLREIEISARLHHPHILPLFDSGDADGFLFYTMPLVEGESLRDRLNREKQLPVDDALRIAREVADGLSYAHNHDVVHRDVKPENILLESGHAMVADFGIARAMSAAGGPTLTATGMAIGTPAYMSPEQVAGENPDGRSDLYALGCVLYEMLAGQPPFTGPTVESLVRQHLAADPPRVTDIRPTVPASVSDALQRALAKTPADRFSTVGLFADALGDAERGMRETQRTTPPPRVRSARSRSLPIVLLVLLVAAALTWSGWRALQPGARSISFAATRQISREPALEIQAAISPDGREVVYASGYPGSTHIEVRDIAGGRSRSLTGDWQGEQAEPRWTPDGLSVRFRNVRPTVDHAAGVWTIPRMGGQAVAAGPGATVAVAEQRVLEQRADSFFARNADGSATLLFADIQEVHSAAWSPDGSRLAFVKGNEDYVHSRGWGNLAPSSIWVVPVGGTLVRVTDDASLNISPAWLPDGRLLFVSNRDGPRDLYALQLGRGGSPRGTPVRLTNGLDAFSVSVSTDGATVAYDKFLFRRNIFALPILRSGSVSIREARPVTNSNQIVESLSISRDGQWLGFDSNLDGTQQIYVMPAAGGEPRRVTRDPRGAFAPDFSPDGREIAFHSQRNATRDIYLVKADGTGEQQLTSDSAQSFQPAFSPDGLRIAYINSLPRDIYVLRRGTIGGAWSTPELIARESGVPRWSPDGTRLAAAGRLGTVNTITLAGTERTLFASHADSLRGAQWPEWSPDGSTVYFRARTPDGVDGLYAIPAAGGSPRLVVRFDDPALQVGGGVTIGDGRFYFAVAQMESDIYVMNLVRR